MNPFKSYRATTQISHFFPKFKSNNSVKNQRTGIKFLLVLYIIVNVDPSDVRLIYMRWRHLAGPTDDLQHLQKTSTLSDRKCIGEFGLPTLSNVSGKITILFIKYTHISNLRRKCATVKIMIRKWMLTGWQNGITERRNCICSCHLIGRDLKILTITLNLVYTFHVLL